jgi:hypothetical protein
MKINLGEARLEVVDWFNVALNGDRRRAGLNMVMNFMVP